MYVLKSIQFANVSSFSKSLKDCYEDEILPMLFTPRYFLTLAASAGLTYKKIYIIRTCLSICHKIVKVTSAANSIDLIRTTFSKGCHTSVWFALD